MKNKIIKETLSLTASIGFGVMTGMFYAIWILK